MQWKQSENHRSETENSGKILAVIVFLISACMIMPLVWAVREGGNEIGPCHSIALGSLFSITLLFSYKAQARTWERERPLPLSLWPICIFQGCLPYYLEVMCPISQKLTLKRVGFTTTGATIFRNIEALPGGSSSRAVTRCRQDGDSGHFLLLPMLGMGGTAFRGRGPGLS